MNADGLSYTWPDVPTPGSDNLEAAGQRIALGPVEGATKLGFLATAIKGPADTVATVAYTDGSLVSTPLSFSDWTPGNLQANNSLVFETTYRDTTAGTDTTHAAMYSSHAAAGGGQAARVGAPDLADSGQLGDPRVRRRDRRQADRLDVGGRAGGRVGAGDARADAGRAGELRGVRAGRDQGLQRGHHGDRHLDGGRRGADRLRPRPPGQRRVRAGEPAGGRPAPASWSGPVTGGVAGITFKQHVDANDPLRTGAYSKTLTFTLSTTSP